MALLETNDENLLQAIGEVVTSLDEMLKMINPTAAWSLVIDVETVMRIKRMDRAMGAFEHAPDSVGEGSFHGIPVTVTY